MASHSGRVVTGFRPTVVFFDFDGVLVDTETPLFLAWRHIFREQGVPELTRQEWVDLMLTSSLDYDAPFRLLRTRSGREVDAATCAVVRRRFRRSHLADEPLRPGVETVLRNLAHAEVRVGIVTSSPLDWIEQNVPHRDFLTHFDVIVSSSDGNRKPMPDLYVTACRELDVYPAMAVAVEDSPCGVASAKSAGLYAVGYPTALTETYLDDADVVTDELAATLGLWFAHETDSLC